MLHQLRVAKRPVYWALVLSFLTGTTTFASDNFVQSVQHQKQIAAYVKVWGFLKYYAPRVAKKRVDWDQKLLNHYPRLTEPIPDSEFQEIIQHLIRTASPATSPIKVRAEDRTALRTNRLQVFPNFSSLYANDRIAVRISFGWILNPIFSEENQQLLFAVLMGFKPVNNKYVKGGRVVKPVEHDFLEEDSVTNAHYLLGLARYWNIIEYFFPYKYLTDNNWDTVLVNHAMKFIETPDYWAYYRAITRLNHEIQDTHARMYFSNRKYIPKPTDTISKGPFGVPPYILRYIDSSLYVDRVLVDTAMLKPKDKIIRFVGFDLDSVRSSLYHHNSYSTQHSFDQQFELVNNYRYDNVFEYTVVRNGDTLAVSEKCHISSAEKNKHYYRIQEEPYYAINDSVGYIDLTEAKLFQFTRAMRKYRKKKEIIFDLRGYPRSLGPVLFPFLLEKQKHPVSRFFTANKDYPGTYIRSRKSMTYKYWFVRPFLPFRRRFKGDVAVIINSEAISYSETTAMILKSVGNKVIFYGSPTTGANGNVVTITLPGGITSWYSSLDWQFANGDRLQRKGVLPDIPISRKVPDLGLEEDVILQEVIRLVTKNNP